MRNASDTGVYENNKLIISHTRQSLLRKFNTEDTQPYAKGLILIQGSGAGFVQVRPYPISRDNVKKEKAS